MKVLAIFGLSVLMSLVSSVVLAQMVVWPWLRTKGRDRVLMTLVAPHTLLRFIGLSFLVPGVVSPALPAAFAVPAAYGDFAAGVLAIIAIWALAKRSPWATVAAWTFNVWGAADFLFAFYAGPHAGINPSDLGAAFYLPTAIVPPLLITHFLIFRALLFGEWRK